MAREPKNALRAACVSVVVTALLAAPLFAHLAATASRGSDAVPPGVEGDWLTLMRDNLRRAEYHFAPMADGLLSAPNRAQGFRTLAGETGVQVVPRTADGGEWRLSLRLAAAGREGDLVDVDDVAPTAALSRVEYIRDGLTEWYINDERGLEQGFTIDSVPVASDSGAPLILEMSFE